MTDPITRPDRLPHRFMVQPGQPVDPVRFLKPCSYPKLKTSLGYIRILELIACLGKVMFSYDYVYFYFMKLKCILGV